MTAPDTPARPKPVDDLIERLNRHANRAARQALSVSPLSLESTLRQAASLLSTQGEEIERLEKDRDQWKTAWEAFQTLINMARQNGGERLAIRCHDAEARALTAERSLEEMTKERDGLREALKVVAGREGECGDSQWDPREQRWRPIRDIARAALEGGQDDG